MKRLERTFIGASSNAMTIPPWSARKICLRIVRKIGLETPAAEILNRQLPSQCPRAISSALNISSAHSIASSFTCGCLYHKMLRQLARVFPNQIFGTPFFPITHKGSREYVIPFPCSCLSNHRVLRCGKIRQNKLRSHQSSSRNPFQAHDIPRLLLYSRNVRTLPFSQGR